MSTNISKGFYQLTSSALSCWCTTWPTLLFFILVRSVLVWHTITLICTSKSCQILSFLFMFISHMDKTPTFVKAFVISPFPFFQLRCLLFFLNFKNSLHIFNASKLLEICTQEFFLLCIQTTLSLLIMPFEIIPGHSLQAFYLTDTVIFLILDFYPVH